MTIFLTSGAAVIAIIVATVSLIAAFESKKQSDRASYLQRFSTVIVRADAIDAVLAGGYLRPGQRNALAPTGELVESQHSYVPRTIDRDLQDLLRTDRKPHPFVIVTGSAGSGKTRAALEALRVALPNDAMIIIPRDGGALAEIVKAQALKSVRRSDLAVFLDDLSEIDLEALTADVLEELLSRSPLLTTMNSRAYSDLAVSSRSGWNVARDAIQRATVILADQTAEQRSVVEARIGPADETETLLRSEQLLRHFVNTKQSYPEGYALMRGAIDWRRASFDRAISEAELRRIFPLYLAIYSPGTQPGGRIFSLALSWATRPVRSNVPLLVRVASEKEASRWAPLDSLVEIESQSSNYSPPAIPSEVWSEFVAIAAPDEALDLGIAAFQMGEYEHGLASLRKAEMSGQASIAGVAVRVLGYIRSGGLVIEGAGTFKAEVRRPIGSEATSALALGDLLSQQGDLEGARAAYQSAIDAGGPDTMPLAAMRLGDLLSRQGDLEGARAAYQSAIDAGGPDIMSLAAMRLGDLLSQQGDLEGARAAYQSAIDAGGPDIMSLAAMRLGDLLSQQGDLEGARAAYQSAIDAGGPGTDPVAAVALGDLLSQQGDLEGARAAYQSAIDAGGPDTMPLAAMRLGDLLSRQGDLEGARAAYQSAIDAGGPDTMPLAAMRLGDLLSQQGDLEGARAAYQSAIDAGGPDTMRLAAMRLGDLLSRQGDLEGARAAYQSAIDAGGPGTDPVAAVALGDLLSQQGDLEGARAAYQSAIDAGGPDTMPLAAVRLGDLLSRQGDLDGARAAYKLAIASGHPDAASWGESRLNRLASAS